MQAILILGAAVWATGPSPTLLRRTAHAAQVWRQQPSSLIIPCGGIGQHGPAEAVVMAELLTKAGIPPELIQIEDRSTTTLENIQNAIRLLDAHQVDRVTIVTDKTHAPRARMVARHFGLNARTDCPPLSACKPLPQLRQALREAVAIPAYALRLRRLKPRR